MALTVEQAEAYEQLEAAVARIDELFRPDPDDFINGWVLIVSSSNFCDEEDEEDEQDMTSRTRGYPRRAQIPALTRGIIEMYQDRWRWPDS